MATRIRQFTESSDRTYGRLLVVARIYDECRGPIGITSMMDACPDVESWHARYRKPREPRSWFRAHLPESKDEDAANTVLRMTFTSEEMPHGLQFDDFLQASDTWLPEMWGLDLRTRFDDVLLVALHGPGSSTEDVNFSSQL